MPDSVNLLPKEILELQETQDAMSVLKESFQSLFDSFDEVMPKSPFNGVEGAMNDTFTKLMGANLIYTAFMEVYKDYVVKANLTGGTK